MNRITQHLRTHWHHHLSVFGVVVGVVVLTSGIGAGIAIAHQIGKGGYQGSPPPPRVKIVKSLGGPLPPSWYLGKYVVRIHNQGSSNSCVGQTLSTIEEITQNEHHRGRIPFSAGYIYDQINGGVDQGATYQDAFTVLTNQGDAPLRAFPHDGIDFYSQPDSYARTKARPYRFAHWRSISPTDRYTMQYELRHGRPLAVAMPWHDGLYNQWNSPRGRPATVWSDYGAYHFWHSTPIIGYNPNGVRILNSWGPQYGANGRITVAWNVIAAQAGQIVASNPLLPPRQRHKHQNLSKTHGRNHGPIPEGISIHHHHKKGPSTRHHRRIKPKKHTRRT